jgi:hypothetical protein
LAYIGDSPKQSRASEAKSIRKSDISLPINTTQSTMTDSSIDLLPKDIKDAEIISTAVKGESHTGEENYPPVVKRKAKEPNQGEIDFVKQLKEICFTVDPNDIYKDMVKIGQG